MSDDDKKDINPDLSDDATVAATAKPFREKEVVSFNFERAKGLQRLLLQVVLVLAVLCASFMLLREFKYFIISVRDVIKAWRPGLLVPFDWHLLFLGTLMVIPATVLLLVVTKAVFSDGSEDKAGALDDVPIVKLLTELWDRLQSIWKR